MSSSDKLREALEALVAEYAGHVSRLSPNPQEVSDVERGRAQAYASCARQLKSLTAFAPRQQEQIAAFEYQHKPNCPKGPDCKCGLSKLVTKLNTTYKHAALALATGAQGEARPPRTVGCTADADCVHECPISESEARLDEFKTTVIALWDPDISNEEKKKYIAARSKELREAAAAPPVPGERPPGKRSAGFFSADNGERFYLSPDGTWLIWQERSPTIADSAHRGLVHEVERLASSAPGAGRVLEHSDEGLHADTTKAALLQLPATATETTTEFDDWTATAAAPPVPGERLAQWAIVAIGEGATAQVATDHDLRKVLHALMCVCGVEFWYHCRTEGICEAIETLDDENNWTFDEDKQKFSISVCEHETGKIIVYRLAASSAPGAGRTKGETK